MSSRILSLVGQRFRPPAQRICDQLERDDPVILVRESENPHDPNAVAVYLHLGYLLAHDARGIAELLDLSSLKKIEGKIGHGPQGGTKVIIEDGKEPS